MNIKKNEGRRIWVEFSLKDYRDHKFLQNDYHADYAAIARKGKSKVITTESYVRLVGRMNKKRAEIKAAAKVELFAVNNLPQSSQVA